MRQVRVFGNTVVARDAGIALVGAAPERTRVLGNAVFAATPIAGAEVAGNVVGAHAEAADALQATAAELGRFDARPRNGRLSGDALDVDGLDVHRDWNRDFEGRLRSWRTRGAFEGGSDGRSPAFDDEPRR
jgi:hypothetical protein